MHDKFSRRGFLGRGGVLATAAAFIPGLAARAGAAPSRAVTVSSINGLRATAMAMASLREGADTLDAALAGIKILEDDPQERGVGYGGLPNEEGIVELDASVMHGPSRRAGAVAGLRDVRSPSQVAKRVMERTDHVLLVGEGALRFALAHGFARETLLTDESRRIWLLWKETMSGDDAWGPGLDRPGDPAAKIADARPSARGYVDHPPTGTVSCLVVNEAGDVSGATSTAGRAFKVPGRVGDSPIIGCGLFVDNAIGAAGATGRGEECLKINGAHTIVEMMRRGLSPTDACLEALKRIAANYEGDRTKLRKIGMDFFAVTKAGEYGGASLWSHERRATETGVSRARAQFAVNDGRDNRLVDAAYLYETPAD
jgi:N4-(beta-N-acetylglucosaminyl)-L-asparaginase